jgi:hypothetical protein
MANRVGAEAITCGWRETHEGVLGGRVHCRHGESNSLHATDLASFAECSPSKPQNFTVKLCVDSLALGDEFGMKNATNVEKHDKHSLH